MIGRRTNVVLVNHTLLYQPDHVTATARERGRIFASNAEDYFFIAFNNFPWQSVADVVIGRRAYDNYFVELAIRQNVTVVDATSTLLALHQTGSDGNYAGHRNSDNNNFNVGRIGPFNANGGLTDSAQYAAKFTKDRSYRTKVAIEKRRRSRHYKLHSLVRRSHLLS